MKTPDLDRICFVTRHFNDLQGLRSKVPVGLVALSAAGGLSLTSPPIPLLSCALLALAFALAAGSRAYYRRRFGEVEARQVESLSIYSPAGLPSAFGFHRPLSPYQQMILGIMAPAFVVFVILQATSPVVMVASGPPQSYGITLDSVFEAQPAWARGVKSIIAGGTPLSLSILSTQLVLLLFGAYFMGVWLWRERHASQGFYLATGALLLGLSALGSCLGYFVYAEGEVLVRLLNAALPVLVRPWVAVLVCGAAMIVGGLLDHWQLVRVLSPAAPHEEEPA